jgi:hypothetical protein
MTTTNALPTLDRLGVTIPDDLDPKSIATEWFHLFCSAVEQNNVAAVADLFAEGALWRDILALIWDFRTFQGPAIQQFLVANCLAEAQMSKLELKGEHLRLIRPYPDIVWIEAMFTRIRLRTACLPISEDLKDFPEKVHSDTTDRPSYSNTL